MHVLCVFALRGSAKTRGTVATMYGIRTYPVTLPQIRAYSKVVDSPEAEDEDEPKQAQEPQPTFNLREAIQKARDEANQRTQEKVNAWEKNKAEQKKEEARQQRENERSIPDNEADGPWKKAFANLKPKDLQKKSWKAHIKYMEKDICLIAMVIINIGILLQISRQKTKFEDNEATLKSSLWALEEKLKNINAALMQQWNGQQEELLAGIGAEQKEAINAYIAQLLQEKSEEKATEANDVPHDKPARFF